MPWQRHYLALHVRRAGSCNVLRSPVGSLSPCHRLVPPEFVCHRARPPLPLLVSRALRTMIGLSRSTDNEETAWPRLRKPQSTPTRADDYPEWYQQVISAADLAENSAGARLHGHQALGLRASGRTSSACSTACSRRPATRTPISRCSSRSASCEKEAEHVEGFAKECAVVTHHRLDAGRRRQADSRSGRSSKSR